MHTFADRVVRAARVGVDRVVESNKTVLCDKVMRQYPPAPKGF